MAIPNELAWWDRLNRAIDVVGSNKTQTAIAFLAPILTHFFKSSMFLYACAMSAGMAVAWLLSVLFQPDKKNAPEWYGIHRRDLAYAKSDQVVERKYLEELRKQPKHPEKNKWTLKTIVHYFRMGPSVHEGAKLIHGSQNVQIWEKDAHKERREVHENVFKAVGMDLVPLEHVHVHWSDCILPGDVYQRLAERAMDAHTKKQKLAVKKVPVSDRQLADMWWDATFDTADSNGGSSSDKKQGR